MLLLLVQGTHFENHRQRADKNFKLVNILDFASCKASVLTIQLCSH